MGDSDDGDRLLLLPPPPPSSSDELSTFLQQILSPSPTIHPSSSSPAIRMQQQQQQPPKRIVSAGDMFDRSFVTSTADGNSDNKAKMNENVQTSRQQRSSLKRNIDAQFHNISEKRRRSKINEKMKALQKLIPNSNKTDKASMLEEAIEYLKQLQLQVQTLAVMNGLGLNPMRLPPVQQQPTQTRTNEPTTTLDQDLNLDTLFHQDPPEVTQPM